MIQIYYSHIPVSVELRIDVGSSAECIIVRKSTLLYYARIHWEFRLAWPRPFGIDMLNSFVLTPGQGHLQIFRPMVAVRSLLEYWAKLKVCSSNVFILFILIATKVLRLFGWLSELKLNSDYSTFCNVVFLYFLRSYLISLLIEPENLKY